MTDIANLDFGRFERRGYAEAVFCLGKTTGQVRAIAENVMDVMDESLGMRPERIEGRSDARWILLDYGDVVVHVLVEEDREYYALEKLWGDRPSIHLGEDAGTQGVSVAV